MPDPRIFPIGNSASTTIVAPAISGPVLEANERRVDAELVNVSNPSEAISLSRGGVAVLGSGLTLTARGSRYRIGTDNMWYGIINAISASGIAGLSIEEGTN